jgi:periplasmic divalent cation tolerance protein
MKPAMPECNEDDIVAVTTTVASMEDARMLAQAVVQAHLAACAQLDAIAASFYEWEGRVREEPEVRLTLKTTGAQLEALQAFFAGQHPYALPQFVAVRCDASDQYADWVRAQVKR